MRNRSRIIVLAVAVALAVVPSTAVAEEEASTYLSLGTSLAAGTTANAIGENILFTDHSYTDQLAGMLGEVDHIKLGCPGETTATFTYGGICYTGGVSQLSVAQSILASGEVDLVTIDMGANDFLQATPDILACGADEACIFGVVSGIAANVGATLDGLLAADPDANIIGMNYYNPSLAAWVGHFAGVPVELEPDPDFAILTTGLSALGNDLIEFEYYVRGIPVVDVEALFRGQDFGDRNGNGVPNNVEQICKFTTMCPPRDGVSPNIHANVKGYEKIARGFFDLLMSGAA